MSDTVIRVENLSKLYRLGMVGTGTLRHDFNRWWHRIRGKEDPYLKVGESNVRSSKGKSDFIWALKNIDFEVQRGEIIGIFGENGAGKSTLLKLLSRLTGPTTGRIALKGRVATLLEVGVGFHGELTGRENIYLNGSILGMSRSEVSSKLDDIVDFAGVARYIDTPVKRYSSGMYIRLGFSVAAHLQPDIMIVDEVLAVGDINFQKQCLAKLEEMQQQEGRTILFVSHNMHSIQQLCTRGIYLQHGEVAGIGDVDTLVREYVQDVEERTKSFQKVLEYVDVYQHGDKLVITCRYNCPEELDVPHFGFVVSNEHKQPIFGSNPTIEMLDYTVPKNRKSGRIKVTVQEPKLLDGEYYLSVYFGNSGQDFVEDEYSMTFTINNMTKKKQLSPTVVGHAMPVCQWEFTD